MVAQLISEPAMQHLIDGKVLRLTRGDITNAPVDAIVSAANQHLAGGGGVDGAIHRAGGPSIIAECQRIGHCATGNAVTTGGGRLPAKFVIHAVAPRWHGGDRGEAEQLASAYRRSMEEAERVGANSVAFPSLGTGAYGYPIGLAAEIALRTTFNCLSTAGTVHAVTFYLFSNSDLAVYERTLARLQPGTTPDASE